MNSRVEIGGGLSSQIKAVENEIAAVKAALSGSDKPYLGRTSHNNEYGFLQKTLQQLRDKELILLRQVNQPIVATSAGVSECAPAEVKAPAATIRVEPGYFAGDEVVYMRHGKKVPAVVMTVHADHEQPYYTIRVDATGAVVQTEINNLEQKHPRTTSDDSMYGPGPAWDAPGEETNAAQGSEPEGAPGPRRGDGVPAQGIHAGGDAAWLTSSGFFRKVAADLQTPRASSGEVPVTKTLASAFAAAPAAEVCALLRRKLAERKEKRQKVKTEEGLECSPGEFGGGVNGLDDVVGEGTTGKRKTSHGQNPGPSVKGPGESAAYAVADACSEMVVTCLLGQGARGRIEETPVP